MSKDETANLLGALALVVGDKIRVATERVAGHTGETPAALSVLGFEPGLSNKRLGQILGLSHPATVRLIDRLSAVGLVDRRAAQDGRAVSLHLTGKGKARRDRLLESRQSAIAPLLNGLTEKESKGFAALLRKILATNFAADELMSNHVCRLCNVDICDDCPFETAASL